MSIIKDVTVKINNGTATLDAPIQFYEKDHDVELRFKLMDYKYKYDRDPQNILNSVNEDILEAYTTIVNPRGYELEQINGVVTNDVVIFRLDPTYTDELDELGTYKLQMHIKCTHSEFTIPPITFEVLQRLKGIKVVTDGEDEVDNSEILDNSSKFVSDETGKLIIEWKKGDVISSAKLNAMVDVINDAVDEEVIRQANEVQREQNANNKIQQLENARVEYINKIDTELDSFADQVDASMTDYETRFNALTVSQQQDAEVIDARDGEQTLSARLDRDIQNLSIIYEDIEKINKLEESAVSTVTTESDFTTVKNTSNGYFEVVKLEGKTLVNLAVFDSHANTNWIINDSVNKVCTFNNPDFSGFIGFKIRNIKPNTVYTVIFRVLEMTLSSFSHDLYPDTFEDFGAIYETGVVKRKFTTPRDISTFDLFRCYVNGASNGMCKFTYPIVLEGDYTQNQPEYFEGAMSVGQDADITITTTNAPMIFGKGGKK